MQQNELKNRTERHFERKVAKSFAEEKSTTSFQNEIQVWLLYSIHLGILTNCWKWFSSIGENIQY